MALFIPTYFSPISQYSKIIQYSSISFEVEDNFQKQSYRNRCYIYNSNGKQLLNIPVKHQAVEGRKKTKDMLVENNVRWQDHHFKSLNAAYKSSPFFEFYQDDLAVLFQKKYTFLQDVTIDSFLFIIDALQLDIEFTRTTTYSENNPANDFRALASSKQHIFLNQKKYTQVFDNKHGFISNLSILDLLFMEGPNTISYLK